MVDGESRGGLHNVRENNNTAIDSRHILVSLLHSRKEADPREECHQNLPTNHQHKRVVSKVSIASLVMKQEEAWSVRNRQDSGLSNNLCKYSNPRQAQNLVPDL